MLALRREEEKLIREIKAAAKTNNQVWVLPWQPLQQKQQLVLACCCQQCTNMLLRTDICRVTYGAGSSAACCVDVLVGVQVCVLRVCGAVSNALQASMKILAKSLVRLRAQIAKLHGSAANLKGVSTNLTVSGLIAAALGLWPVGGSSSVSRGGLRFLQQQQQQQCRIAANNAVRYDCHLSQAAMVCRYDKKVCGCIGGHDSKGRCMLW